MGVTLAEGDKLGDLQKYEMRKCLTKWAIGLGDRVGKIYTTSMVAHDVYLSN